MTPAVPGGAPGPGGRGHHHRVLVADDNVDAATSLALLLEVLGHDVRTAFNGVDAVRSAAEFHPALVLLDIGMPRLNGYEAARRIRAQPWAAHAMIVAVTGQGRDEDRRRAAAAGFDRHFTKPISPDEIGQLLDELP